ncbi:putative lipid II flippase FtsW [Marisediminicola senii]|uniref:putative lipid II flippase FtsW n=1 Tax=Marisediminicola senii TaxID=2711233 RepID=UPI0013EDE5CA|nr:putative lipid II flippase FtsW [Marisediminicola senii]
MTTTPHRPTRRTTTDGPQVAPTSTVAPSGTGSGSGSGSAAIIAVKKLFVAETGNFYLLLGTTLFLVVFGLVMVLSSSSVTSYMESDDFFSGFARQGLFALLGVPIMLIASRMPTRFWRRWAGTAVGIGVTLQLLVVFTGLGVSRGGNRNWLDLGGLSVQPSEITKVALTIWLAHILTLKADRINDLRQLAMPIVPVAGVAIGLVLYGGDLGTAIILLMLVGGALFFAGVRLRFLLIPVVLAAVSVPLLALSSNSRGDRIDVWLDGCSSASDYAQFCWQTVHGWWALASGGLFGAGLGNSKAKWSWLPEADNDFIFAIIGEELGLLGAITVLVLFIVLAVTFSRIIRSNPDPFARITTSAVMVWIIGQAFINIAVVLGVLPVLGVPLPLISSGGSALVTTLFGIGIVLSFARERPAVAGAPGIDGSRGTANWAGTRGSRA